MEQDYIFQASEFPGEVTIENSLKPETPTELVNKLANRLLKVITFKVVSIKNLIIFTVLAVIWLVLILLPHLGYNPLVVKILSFLTFSQGGASKNAFKVLGGLAGKSIFLMFIATMLDGSVKKIHQGLRPFFKGLKQNNKNGLFYLFIGIGSANIIFNFLVGYSAIIKGVIGIVLFLLILIALKTTRGFIYRFIFSVIRKYKKIETEKIEENVNAFLSGQGVGYILAVLLALIPFGYTPYLVGLLFLTIGVLFFFLDKTQAKKIIISILVIFISVLFSLKLEANEGLKGEWVYKKTQYRKYSDELKEYYKENLDDKTQMNYEVKDNNLKFYFNYLGEGINDDLYEDALENPENYRYIDIILPNEYFKASIDINKLEKNIAQTMK